MIQIIIIKVLSFLKTIVNLIVHYKPFTIFLLHELTFQISYSTYRLLLSCNVNASLISHRPYSKTHWVIHSPFLLYFFFEILLVYIWISWRTLQYIHGEVWMRSPKIIHSLSNSKWEEYGVRGSDISLKET